MIVLKTYFQNATTLIRNTFGRIIRQTGLQMDYRGSRLCAEVTPLQPLNRHRNILSLYEHHPALSSTTYVAPNATLIGAVYAASNTYFSFGCVINGFNYPIRIGANTRVGQNTVIETYQHVPDQAFPVSTNIGNNVRIQHDCALISCIVDDNVHIGHRSSIHEGAQIQRGAVIGPNSVVPAGTRIPEYTYWVGTPVQFVRNLTEQQIKATSGRLNEPKENIKLE